MKNICIYRQQKQKTDNVLVKLHMVFGNFVILWHTDPLLGKDLKIKRQHASTTTTTTELLLETMFSTWSMQRGYKEDNQLNQAVKRRLGGEMVSSLGVII
jgi:hypothetical protein